MFTHVVLFFLKPAAPADAAERLKTDCLTLLSSIPVVRRCDAGYPVASPRPVVASVARVMLVVVVSDWFPGSVAA